MWIDDAGSTGYVRSILDFLRDRLAEEDDVGLDYRSFYSLFLAFSAGRDHELVILYFSQVDLYVSPLVSVPFVCREVFHSTTYVSIRIHLDRTTASFLHDLLPPRVQFSQQLLPLVSFEYVMVFRAVHIVQGPV
jgi:hypothetical protein